MASSIFFRNSHDAQIPAGIQSLLGGKAFRQHARTLLRAELRDAGASRLVNQENIRQTFLETALAYEGIA